MNLAVHTPDFNPGFKERLRQKLNTRPQISPRPNSNPHRIPHPHQSLPGNQLLAALPRAELDMVAPHLVPVALGLGDVLYEPHHPIRHAFFPTSAVISLHYVTCNGAEAEIASVGHEGMAGFPLFLGGDTTSSSAVVKTAGHAFRLDRRVFEEACERSGAMQHLMLRYTQVLITQVSLSGACNRHHSVDQQLCRYLLQALDRAPGRELVMTQELVAHMLGVRRESVTEAARKLQKSGFIDYRRGHITVVDRKGLESRSCECYGVIKKELDRLFSDVHYPEDRARAFR